MRFISILGLAFGLAACSGETATPEPEPAPEPAPEPEPEPEPAPAGDAVDVAKLNAEREAHVGKTVAVTGFYMGTTKQGDPVEQLNVSVHASEDMGSESILCVASPEHDAAFSALTQKDSITVTGTVAEEDFLGKAKLTDCILGLSRSPKEPDVLYALSQIAYLPPANRTVLVKAALRHQSPKVKLKSSRALALLPKAEQAELRKLAETPREPPL